MPNRKSRLANDKAVSNEQKWSYAAIRQGLRTEKVMSKTCTVCQKHGAAVMLILSPERVLLHTSTYTSRLNNTCTARRIQEAEL